MKKKTIHRYKSMEKSAQKGIPGVYSAAGYHLKRILLPAVLIVCLVLATYFAVDNELRTMGAYSPDKLTIYVLKQNFSVFDNLYNVKAPQVGVELSYDQFTQLVDIKGLSSSQQEQLLRRHQKVLSDRLPAFIVITRDNELFNTYDSMLDLAQMVQDLKNSGYLEVQK